MLAADFYPADSKLLVTCGKSHIAFWKLNGDKRMEKKMGVFEVRRRIDRVIHVDSLVRYSCY